MDLAVHNFNHDAENVREALGVNDGECKAVSMIAVMKTTVSEMIEVVYLSDLSEVEKMYTCLWLGGYLEFMKGKVEKK